MITVTNRLNIKDMASRVMMKVFLLSLGAEFSNSEVPSSKFKLVGLRDHGAKSKFHLVEVGDGDGKTSTQEEEIKGNDEYEVGGDDDEELHHQGDRMADPGVTGDDYFFGGNLQQCLRSQSF